MNFIKLTNFEWNRLAKLLAVLLALVFAIQLGGTIVESNVYMEQVNSAIKEDGMSEEQVLGTYARFNYLNISTSAWFYGPIFIGVASVLFYIFFIWYRDWFGKNTFIYRLLMLPTERINVYLAKLATILMMTISFIAAQLIFLRFNMQVMKWIVKDPFREDMGIREIILHNIDTGILFPRTFTEFVLYYGAGIMFVAVVFTAILFERSFRFPGIIMGGVYVLAATLVFLGPVMINELALNHYLFAEEVALLTILSGMVVMAASIGTSSYLLRNKIRV